MAIKYGIAKLNQRTGQVVWHTHLPVAGVDRGTLTDFLRDAGDEGWELCASYPTAAVGLGYQDEEGNLKVCKDSADEIALIFKRTE
jgi:hypothetical protein